MNLKQIVLKPRFLRGPEPLEDHQALGLPLLIERRCGLTNRSSEIEMLVQFK